MEDATIQRLGVAGVASLLLVLSYLFSSQEGSGSVPVILLFAGLLLAFLFAVVALTGVGGSG
jgi:hypothetical protein